MGTRIMAAALAAAVAAGATAAELPLRRGFYLSADTPCGQASTATLMLLHRDGIGGARDFCAFEAVAAEGPARFRIRETCADLQDPANGETTERVWDILGPASFRAVRSDGWTLEARLCEQGALPDPWRDADISDVVD